MPTVIRALSGGQEIRPLIVDGYQAARGVRTVVHPILGRSEPDVTFRPADLRKGTLSLVMADATVAHASSALLLTSTVFELSDADVPQILMRFVVADGDVSLQLDPVTRRRWLLAVPFQEVLT